jgi:DNA/RNA-binding domain of Phe-tRNA-synthetase-like protein
MAVRIDIEPALTGVVRLGVLRCGVGRVRERDASLDAPLAAAEEAVRAGDVAGIESARALYRAFGIDPTRTRPSSEALLRRVRRGEPLPRINTAVDVCNWCSLEAQLPYGLYDADAIEPPVALRRGGPGDEYAGIRKDVVHLDGRPALFDARGPFGNPTSDSARTMTGVRTRAVMAVVFAPRSLPPGRMSEVLDMTAERLAEYAEGREMDRWVS